jgi:hypothetical protein
MWEILEVLRRVARGERQRPGEREPQKPSHVSRRSRTRRIA